METPNIVQTLLKHHGVKGQKWGVRRKATVGAGEVVVRDSRKKLKATGGKGFPTHSDAIRTKVIGQVRKKSGVKALSNSQIEEFNKRVNLEQNMKRLNFQQSSAGKKFALTLLGQTGKSAAQSVATQASTKLVKKAVFSAAV